MFWKLLSHYDHLATHTVAGARLMANSPLVVWRTLLVLWGTRIIYFLSITSGPPKNRYVIERTNKYVKNTLMYFSLCKFNDTSYIKIKK